MMYLEGESKNENYKKAKKLLIFLKNILIVAIIQPICE